LTNIPLAFTELGRAERDIDAIRITEDDVVVSKSVTILRRAALASAGPACLERVSLQHPVTKVNDVNVLFDYNVARKCAIVNPVAKPMLDRRGARPGWPVEVRCEVVGFAANDPAESAIVDTADQFHERRAIADLEPHVKA